MEIRSNRSFNAIPTTLIRGVLTCIHQICYVNCFVTFIFLSTSLNFLTIVNFFHFVAKFYLPTYLPIYLPIYLPAYQRAVGFLNDSV